MISLRSSASRGAQCRTLFLVSRPIRAMISLRSSASRGAQCRTLSLVSRPIRAMISLRSSASRGWLLRPASMRRVRLGTLSARVEAEHGSQFMQSDLAVLAAEPGGGRSSDVRIAATRQSRTDEAEVITNRLEDGLPIACGQLTSTRKRWIRQDRPGQLPQPSDEPLRAQHPATEGRAERRGRRTPQTCLHEAPVGTTRDGVRLCSWFLRDQGWCQTLFLVLTCCVRNQEQSLTPQSLTHHKV